MKMNRNLINAVFAGLFAALAMTSTSCDRATSENQGTAPRAAETADVDSAPQAKGKASKSVGGSDRATVSDLSLWKIFMAAANAYDDPAIPNLRYAVNDLDALRQALIDAGANPENIVVFKTGGKEPVKRALEDALDEYAKSLQDDDLAVVFLAGHGVQPAGSGTQYFLPRDARAKDLIHTGVSIQDVIGRLQGSRARTKLMFVDACRNKAGTSVEGLSGAELIAFSNFSIIEAESVAILQSCRPGQVSLESAVEEHGYFTLGLLEALALDDNPGDLNGDGRLTLMELTGYVASATERRSLASSTLQTPTISGETTDFDLLSGLSENGVSPEDRTRAEELYSEAQELFRAGEYAGAREKIEAALKLRRIGKYEELQQWIARSLATGESDGHYQEALRLRNAGSYRAALAEVEQALESVPGNGVYESLRAQLEALIASGEEEYQAGRKAYWGLDGVRMDYDEGVRQLEVASEKGNIAAQGLLAYAYFEGRAGRKREFEKAFDIASREEVAESDPFAALVLEHIWRCGCEIVDRDAKKSEVYHKQALAEFSIQADRGDPIALYFNGQMLYSGGGSHFQNASEGWKRVIRAADSGVSAAVSYVASALILGSGTACDYKAGLQWAERGSEMGNSDAMYLIGLCFENGLSVDRDPSKALEWYLKSAEAGAYSGQLNAARCYLNGIGVPPNPEKALEMYRKGMEENDPEATAELAALFLQTAEEEDDQTAAMAMLWETAKYGSEQFVAHMGLQVESGSIQPPPFAAWLIEEGAENYPLIAYYRGVCCKDGLGRDQDPLLAIEYFKKSYEAGVGGAAGAVGNMYMTGNGVRIDYDEGLRWYRLGTEKGDPGSFEMLGDCCRDGIGLEQNDEEAAKYYRKAIKYGLKSSMTALGKMLEEGRVSSYDAVEAQKEAIRLYMEAGENGQAALARLKGAQTLLGGGDHAAEEAEKYYRRAVELGDYSAAVEFGKDLLYGTKAMPKDPAKAVEWFQIGAEEGETGKDRGDSLCMLGICYKEGLGVAADEKKAVACFRDGVDALHADSHFHLGKAYLNGWGGLRPDPEMALELYRKAAKLGSSNALVAAAKMYRDGLDVKPDPDEYLRLLRQAVDKENPLAMVMLGDECMSGKVVPRSPEEGAELFRQAAELGWPDGMFRYSECLRRGEGGEHNAEEWRKWLQKAFDAGYSPFPD